MVWVGLGVRGCGCMCMKLRAEKSTQLLLKFLIHIRLQIKEKLFVKENKSRYDRIN